MVEQALQAESLEHVLLREVDLLVELEWELGIGRGRGTIQTRADVKSSSHLVENHCHEVVAIQH